MRESTKDRIKGKFHVVRGTVRERVGQITSNRRLRLGGQVERTAGRMRQTVGQIEGLLGK